MKRFKRKPYRKNCVKFITNSDGDVARLYINGKYIKDCCSAEIKMDDVGLRVDYVTNYKDENGRCVLTEDRKNIVRNHHFLWHKRFQWEEKRK